MKSRKFSRILAGTVVALSLGAIATTALTVSWFLGPNISTEDDNYLNGQIGLREYFFSGDGSEEKPYEIVSPVHFYNLTRLQNLGIFPRKTYFQIGHVFDIEGVPTLKCINSYEDDGTPNYADYLDMEEFCNTSTLYTIGGEGVPFVGEINGNGLPIKNLTVHGYPEDIGVFGYVASGAKLEGLVFDNLEIISLGYNSTVGDLDNLLFSEDIDDIFTSSSFLETNTSLGLYQHNSVTGDYDYTDLKHINGTGGTYIQYFNTSENIVTVGEHQYFNGYFKATFPTDDRFTYTLISSTPALVKKPADLNLQGASEEDFVFDLAPLAESSTFNSTAVTQVNTRLYLTASCVVDGYTFSRVIQSYEIEIHNNGKVITEEAADTYIYCDYVNQNVPDDHNTSYHHGVNVGLIVGHLDGSMKSCFVYNGKFTFNATEYTPMASESQTALVGELSQNVANEIDPDLGLVVHGDIGVMNFSRIYSMIRSNATTGKVVKAGQRTPMGGTGSVNYISYKEFINEETIDNFKDYLKYYDGLKDEYEFITKTDRNMSASSSSWWHNYTIPAAKDIPDDFNSVDFLWNKVLEDDDGIDRGLGVFKVVSSFYQYAKDHPESYGEYMVNGLGACRIINTTPKTKVYFSTAEYDHSVINQPSFSPLRATTLPTYSDVQSFGYPFSRDYNYCFELDLAQMSAAGGNDYMWNNNSDFLTNYLSSKLITKYGGPVTPGTARFGFMFRSSENELLSSLSSYMPVGVPGNKDEFTDSKGNTRYYPSNSIVFRIDNPNGANVSVVGNNDDITVYDYDPDTPDGGASAKYTMKASGYSGDDQHRYFTYDVVTGNVGTSAVVNDGKMGDGGCLYGHIFKLPQGDYVLGARSGTANIFFLAVQGQTEGTIGQADITSLEDNLDDVEFLLEEPVIADYPAGFNKALFTFRGQMNSASGDIYMEAVTIGDKKYMRVRFNNSPLFVTYMLLYSRHVEHTYYFNNDLKVTPTYIYEPLLNP